jgi:hypothetical protein
MTDDPGRIRLLNAWIIAGVILVVVGTVTGVLWGLSFYPA